MINFAQFVYLVNWIEFCFELVYTRLVLRSIKNNNIINIKDNYKLFVSKQVIDTCYLFQAEFVKFRH
jgi:hypothetical protein